MKENKLLSIVIIVLMILMTLTPSIAAADFSTHNEPIRVLGDSDYDGAVTIKDATEIQKHLADLPSFENIGKEIVAQANPSSPDEEATTAPMYSD